MPIGSYFIRSYGAW